MGVDLGKLISFDIVELKSLSGKRIAIDAFNALYQFLSIIRQADGTPLMNSEGKITSHLSGLFYRNVRLLEHGILPSYVFDGKPPQLKSETIQTRKSAKVEAKAKWAEALEKGELEKAKSYATRTSKLEGYMLENSKELLDAMGLPWVQAPSEGESQAAYICQQGDVWSVGSQDFDSFLFGSPCLLRNINITGRRKIPRQNRYVEVKPEMATLKKALDELKITREQLIDIGILVGTDFNEGIKGIGPKKALKLVTESSIETEIEAENIEFDVEPAAVRDIFLNPEITKDYKLDWKAHNPDKIIEILCEKNDFSKERVESSIAKLDEHADSKKQQSLGKWF